MSTGSIEQDGPSSDAYCYTRAVNFGTLARTEVFVFIRAELLGVVSQFASPEFDPGSRFKGLPFKGDRRTHHIALTPAESPIC
jgi:hypothetical protein